MESKLNLFLESFESHVAVGGRSGAEELRRAGQAEGKDEDRWKWRHNFK